MDFNAAALFVKVVRYGSFSETARRTNIPVATVSRRIKELEQELGIRLLERSTRSLRLTDAGAKFLEYVAQGVEALEMGWSALDCDRVEVLGTLRLSLPPGFIPWRKLLQDFQSSYPQAKIELYVTERRIDLVEDGIDVALRIGEIKDKSATKHKLGEYRHLLVASPALLKKYGTPIEPQDLVAMPCASWKTLMNSQGWQLSDRVIEIEPFFQVNDYLHLLELTLAGKCVSKLPPFLVRNYLANKQLQHLLPNYPLPLYELNLLCSSRPQQSRLVRAYLDFCIERTANLF